MTQPVLRAGLGLKPEHFEPALACTQPGLWFVGGSFSNCRIFARYVALQIKAIEEGLLQKEAASEPGTS